MFVSIIFDTEYMGMGERIKWFLKSLSHAKEMDAVVITHEYLKKNFETLLGKCNERFFEEFEMRHIKETEMEEIDIYYIPDSFFHNLEKKYGTRSKAVVELSYNRNEELEKYLLSFIELGLAKRSNRKIEGIFNCLHCLKSIGYIAQLYHCPIIPYVFSAIRKVHGYTQTLYMANMSAGLMNNQDVRKLYEDFTSNKPDGISLLSKKEILALLGKEKHLPLLSLLEEEGRYELGVANSGYRVTPQSYYIDYATDDDIYYEANKYYDRSQIISRVHPMMLDQIGIGRDHIQNDPITFILGCKRLATVQSQMVIKAALWNRVPCVFSDALPFSFLCSKDITSNESMTDDRLNFILFCYFIPDSCMFNREYWLWRMSNPPAKEIYVRHLEEILVNRTICKDILYTKENRLEHFLKVRGMPDAVIENILNGAVKGKTDYEYISSRIDVIYHDKEQKSYYCMNYCIDYEIVSEFYIEEKKTDTIIFYPLDGWDGFVKIAAVQLQSKKAILDTDFEYCPKGERKFIFKDEVTDGYILFRWKVKNCDTFISENNF